MKHNESGTSEVLGKTADKLRKLSTPPAAPITFVDAIEHACSSRAIDPRAARKGGR